MSNNILIEGKTKIVYEYGPRDVVITNKDDITAGDGARRDVIADKAVLSTRTNVNCFELLRRHGIPTHYVAGFDSVSFVARRVNMIPLELVVRRIATGSYLKRRPDVTEGTIFDDLVVEFFHKDDPNHDPLAIIDLVGRRMLRYVASRPIEQGYLDEHPIPAGVGASTIDQLVSVTRDTFTVLEAAWASQNVTLVDLKIECGFDATTGELLVADEVTNDGWRLWPGGDKSRQRDKQVYRELVDTDDPAAKAKELGAIKKNYAWVADATDKFALL